MRRVAQTYNDYMENHKIEIYMLIKKGWKIKQIAKMFKISSTTLSDYLYLWENGIRKQKGNYIKSIRQVEKLPLMQRISKDTKERINHNTIINNQEIKRPEYPRNFFGDSLEKIISKLVNNRG